MADSKRLIRVGMPTELAREVATQIDDASGTPVVVPTASDTNPAAPGSAAPGTSDDFARGDHVHPLQSSVNTLTTGRTIYGVSFNGSADVTLTEVVSEGTAITIPAGTSLAGALKIIVDAIDPS